MSKILDSLNKEQREAVTHREGPLLIIAGAGTGKTTVITRRISWLLAQGLAKTDEILALTFTEKATRQMQERVDILLPYGYLDIWISTFHAFGDRLLRENALVAGLDPDFKVLTLPEAAVFFREHLFEFSLSYYRPLADPTRFIEALISLFSRAKDEDISPGEYLEFTQGLLRKAKEAPQDKALEERALQQIEVAGAYSQYQELLARYGLLDFGNQFYLALELLRTHPAVLQKYQQQFKYILVDEFQDTNFAQFQIIKLLAGNRKNIAVVADDDQCIYRWRGAAYSNVLNFISEYPAAEKVSLIQNYRSTQVILDSAYRLIQHNNPERFEIKAHIDKRLVSTIKEAQPVHHLHFEARSNESDAVARMIKEKVQSGEYTYRDFAILVRSNSDAEPFLQSLNMRDIPWQFSGNQGLYTREEVKLCIHFLRVAANPYDSLSFYYLLSSEVYGFDLAELSLCAHYAKRRNKPLYQVFRELGGIDELKGLRAEFLSKVRQVLEDIEAFLKTARQESAGRLLYSFLTDTGYLKTLTAAKTLEQETKIQNLARFFSIVRDFELVAKEPRVINFVNYLNLLIEAGDDPSGVEADEDSDAVNVLTIHKAKGLEFRIVFLVSLVHGRFPWPHRRQALELPDELIKEVLPVGDFHIQEERRLFYVGMTRAKQELFLTSSSDYGGTRVRRVSQFVGEALGKEVLIQAQKKTSAIEQIEHFALPQESIAAPAGVPSADKLISLSYYQLDDYLTCPLKYKYVNILRIPILEHHTVIYGRAMHEAVCKFFQHKAAGINMDLAELLETFSASFDPQGFLDEKHQEERLRIGKEALVRFFNDERTRKSRPLFIEKGFSFMFEHNKIAGRFDRVDDEGGQAVIMDFKTSDMKTKKEAEKRAKESLQLSLYAFAYQQIFGSMPIRAELYFLESGLVGSRVPEAGDIEGVKEKIRLVSDGIRQKRFEAMPAYMACTYCAYSQICPFAMR
ncbi:MAG: PD-(D/E)XK nuclease family protein [Candidatus Omnitrophota bacterium]|nr:MAG: PD-(D/E)XK nuclease family protein [Candidatus Omnitrophota bacterium]